MGRTGRGIDFSQAMRIAETTVSLELRQRSSTSGAAWRISGLFFTIFTYLLAGLFMGAVFATGRNPFTAGFISSTALMLFVASFVVIEFATIVTGPEDYSFYLPLPVSAPTFVAAKLAVACLFSLVFALAFAVPFLNIAAFRGVPLATIAGLLYSLVISSLIVTLLVIVLLGMAVRFVSYARIRSVATYIQLIILFSFYGGFALIQGFLSNAMAAASIPLSALLLIAPSSWGPCVFRLGQGGIPAVGFCLSLLAPPLLFIASLRIISPSYGGKIREAGSRASGSRKRAASLSKSFLWRSPEQRAIALLISNHFRFNPQFRMGILMNIPLTLLFLLTTIIVNKVRLLDPFTPEGRAGFLGTFLLYFAIMSFPYYIKTTLTYSTEAQASWLILASPADRLHLLRASRRFITLFFIIPYLAAMVIVYLAFTHAVVHIIQHFLVISALLFMETEFLVFFMPELPFSRKTTTGTWSAQLLLQFIPALVALIPLNLLVFFVYPRPLLYWPVLFGLLACLAVMRVLGPRFAAGRIADVEPPMD